ncbi:MAG: nucleotidyltransferase domain-containing protein [Candidatus Freyarchaeota archaeon]
MSETSERLMTAAFDLARRLSDVEGVELVVLFGSVARGEADRRSDVDIAIILDTHAGDEAKESGERVQRTCANGHHQQEVREG